MKILTKALCLVLVMGLLLVAVPTASAEIIILDPEKSTSLTLKYANVCAVEGQIIFSNPSIISNIRYDTTNCNMEGLVENGTIFLYSSKPDGVSGWIDITVTVHSGAIKGASCDITFQYATIAPGETLPGAIQTVTNTVTVSTAGAEPPATTTTPSTKPSNPSYTDTTALRKQIAIAENLTYYDYTKQTWAEVSVALQNARNQLDSRSQTAVDEATNRLKTALSKLKSMDYSALIAAMDKASDMNQHENLPQIWDRFVKALQNARAQRTSGDQAAVDTATEELLSSKTELMNALEELGMVVEVEKLVKVPTEPDHPYCNNISHTVFLIVMIASLVLNAVLAALIALYFIKRHRNKRDNTPLVEYDIDEDNVEADITG